MKLTILGTGNAKVTKCYNTCFALNEDKEYFMIDGGGGNTILKQLEDAGISWKEISTIFVTHKHIDHLLGIIWMLRMYCQGMARGQFGGEVTIYGHDEVISLLKQMAEMLLTPKETKFIGDKVHLEEVKDGEDRTILGHRVTFFDILSTKAKQFGFSMEYAEGKKLTCCGDEPYNECEQKYAQNSTWLLHEAFCLFSQADKFKPYEKHHSTVKDACELAQKLEAENLILYHTEDKNISRRKELYTEGGSYMFNPETVKAGDKNTSVLLLQEILRARGFKGKNGKALKLTWTADANTIYALKAYQESRKEVLEVDGICGSATWKDLIAI